LTFGIRQVSINSMTATLSATRYEDPQPMENERNRIFIELAAQGHHVLETGCATGFLSRCLVERGCVVTGVEIDAQAAERARQWCEKVIPADLNQSDWAGRVGRDFDTILFGDVLEHLVNPELVLRQAAELLAPDGRVIVCLPNIAHWTVRASLLRGKFEYAPHGILDVTHLRFFTPETGRRMIEEAGYRVLEMHRIMGGGKLGNRVRRLLPGLFTKQMIYVAQLAQQ
jgi:2-polyprenyl-3-methyl-5-hydroxy-6-metoxy-1,4-benzoquinol methylase